MCLPKIWHARSVPLRFVSRISAHSSSGTVSVGVRLVFPAQLIRMSTLPKRCSEAASSSSSEARLRTSERIRKVWRPRCSISAAVSSTCSCRRADGMTSAPASARPRCIFGAIRERRRSYNMRRGLTALGKNPGGGSLGESRGQNLPCWDWYGSLRKLESSVKRKMVRSRHVPKFNCFRGCCEQDDGAELKDLVELVGIEPTTSSLRTMRSTKKRQFGVHLAADYGPKRSNSDRLAGSCLTTLPSGSFLPSLVGLA